MFSSEKAKLASSACKMGIRSTRAQLNLITRIYGVFVNLRVNENTVKITEFWLSVWKKWCLGKGIAKEIENYELAELNTLLERLCRN